MPPKQYFKTKLPVDTFVCNHTSFIVVVVIFFIIFSSPILIGLIYAQFFFGKQLQKYCTQNSNFFFASFFLRPITLIFASNFNLSTICQNNLAQDHPPWIFFLSLSSSHSHFYLLIFKWFQFREQYHRWLPTAPQNSHSSLNLIKTFKSNFKNPNTDGIDV